MRGGSLKRTRSLLSGIRTATSGHGRICCTFAIKRKTGTHNGKNIWSLPKNIVSPVEVPFVLFKRHFSYAWHWKDCKPVERRTYLSQSAAISACDRGTRGGLKRQDTSAAVHCTTLHPPVFCALSLCFHKSCVRFIYFCKHKKFIHSTPIQVKSLETRIWRCHMMSGCLVYCEWNWFRLGVFVFVSKIWNELKEADEWHGWQSGNLMEKLHQPQARWVCINRAARHSTKMSEGIILWQWQAVNMD